MWIRRPFLESTAAFSQIVVHGHTPTREVHADARRIGIDTKAYESGVLTALRLEGSARTILRAQSAADGSGVVRQIVSEPLPGQGDSPAQI